MKRVLVCGGRDYADHARLWSVLDHYRTKFGGFAVLIHGAARGADSYADEWAEIRGIPVDPFPISRRWWQVFGNGAGPYRNGLMLREGKPDVVIAFPGKNGTANMIEQAERAGIPVLRIPA
jgi:hypothetical protein